jgi:biopolymer transport protein ExbD
VRTEEEIAMRQLAIAAVALVALSAPVRADDEERVSLGKVPKPVLEAVKKRFPKAEVKEASKETSGDKKMVFEVTLKEKGKNIDVTLTPEGKITLIEKEIDRNDLPKAVAETFDKKYPKATYKIVEEVVKVVDGKENLEYYEATLVTADKKTFEVEVLPDGKFKGEMEKKE